MNREELDAFFAKAEDVLTDWRPDCDAMVARVEDEGAELPRADSYYEQAFVPLLTSSGETVNIPRVPSLADVQRAIREELDFDLIRGVSPVTMFGIVAVAAAAELEARRFREQADLISTACARSVDEVRQAFEGIEGMLRALTGTELTRDAVSSRRPYALQCDAVDRDEGPRERALNLRRERNTGPQDRRGLDGHLRRRTR